MIPALRPSTFAKAHTGNPSEGMTEPQIRRQSAVRSAHNHADRTLTDPHRGIGDPADSARIVNHRATTVSVLREQRPRTHSCRSALFGDEGVIARELLICSGLIDATHHRRQNSHHRRRLRKWIVACQDSSSSCHSSARSFKA